MILPLNVGSEMSKNLLSVRISKAKRSLRLTTNFVDSENLIPWFKSILISLFLPQVMFNEAFLNIHALMSTYLCRDFPHPIPYHCT